MGRAPALADLAQERSHCGFKLAAVAGREVARQADFQAAIGGGAFGTAQVRGICKVVLPLQPDRAGRGCLPRVGASSDKSVP